MAEYDRLLPPLTSLVAFEAAHRHRNFTHAARELHSSQATVSRRVRELETDLGVGLFERHRYDLTPTAEADALAASVRLSLGELCSAAERVRLRAAGADSLTVLASLAMASAVVAPVLTDLQRNHPNLDIRMVTACEPIETTTERFDVAVQYGAAPSLAGRSEPAGSSRFSVEFLARESVYPVCSPSLAARVPNPVTVDDLTGLPLLHVEYDDPSWATWSSFLSALRGDADAGKEGLVFTSYHVCLDAAERGDGIALGWERSVGSRIQAGTLVRLPSLTVPDAGIINAYRPHGSPEPTHVTELLDRLRASLAPDPGQDEARSAPRRPNAISGR